MKKSLVLLFLLMFTSILLISCGGGSDEIDLLKAEIESLKSQLNSYTTTTENVVDLIKDDLKDISEFTENHVKEVINDVPSVETNELKGIKINDVVIDDINSVGGVSFSIYWKNISTKIIKYITFKVEAYNRVGDIVASSIGGEYEKNVRLTGPVPPFDPKTGEWVYIKHSSGRWDSAKYSEYLDKFTYVGSEVKLPEDGIEGVSDCTSWENIWYNNTVSDVVIISVNIEYMDGTTEVIEF
jgi:hypothetical protein